MAPSQFNLIIKDTQFDLLWTFPVLLTVLKKALDINIYNDKIINMLNQWVYYFHVYSPNMHCNRLYWAIVLHSINEYIHSKEIDKQVKTLLFSIDFDNLKYEVDPDILNLQKGWFGIVLLLQKAIERFNNQYPNYEQIDIVRREIVRVCLPRSEKKIMEALHVSEKGERPQLGLATGLSGIGLLYLLYPESLSI